MACAAASEPSSAASTRWMAGKRATSTGTVARSIVSAETDPTIVVINALLARGCRR